ncbi:hypothetical protein F4778DRAFT_522544 [Xylariomycetidae sp. FL2044]|nr:hypothetical protein F4778DRAFT_522544 [Xylariomycetidae sp. FL2044]
MIGPWSKRRGCSLLIALSLSFSVLLLLHYDRILAWSWSRSPSRPAPLGMDVELVVASTTDDDTSWLRKFLPDWPAKIYVTDKPRGGRLAVPVNKGREAMVYLSYLIDFYDALPDVVVFLHARRFQWHNDNPDFDGLQMIQRLRLDHVRRVGYVNLRCTWELGCPVEIRPLDDAKTEWEGPIRTNYVYKEAYRGLMPGREVPDLVGASCCGQFAVSRAAIRRNPKDRYVRWRNWLVETEYEDDVSGKVFEYLWHIMFGQHAVFCPSPSACYCNLYGLCDVDCNELGQCRSMYNLPQYATMPSGWPKIGWDGEKRNFTGPL